MSLYNGCKDEAAMHARTRAVMGILAVIGVDEHILKMHAAALELAPEEWIRKHMGEQGWVKIKAYKLPEPPKPEPTQLSLCHDNADLDPTI